MPLLALCVVEKLAFDTSWFGDLLKYRLGGNFHEAFVDQGPHPFGLHNKMNFHLPQGATRPPLISGTMPQDLPASAGQNVNLSLQVDTEGAITSLTVLNSTDPEWEALIRDAINKWKFSPATQNGQPIPAEGILDVSSPPAARMRLPAAAVP